MLRLLKYDMNRLHLSAVCIDANFLHAPLTVHVWRLVYGVKTWILDTKIVDWYFRFWLFQT